MPVKEQGFSLLEVLIAMAISSVLLLGAARFLPALQRESLTSTRKLALEDEIWLRVFTVAKHLQRAGYCHGSCTGGAFPHVCVTDDEFSVCNIHFIAFLGFYVWQR